MYFFVAVWLELHPFFHWITLFHNSIESTSDQWIGNHKIFPAFSIWISFSTFSLINLVFLCDALYHAGYLSMNFLRVPIYLWLTVMFSSHYGTVVFLTSRIIFFSPFAWIALVLWVIFFQGLIDHILHLLHRLVLQVVQHQRAFSLLEIFLLFLFQIVYWLEFFFNFL